MAQPFAFPPPPPPPPKRDSSTDTFTSSYPPQGRGAGRGRGPSRGGQGQRGANQGGRGRGHGGSRGGNFGRGGHQWSPSHESGPDPNNRYGLTHRSPSLPSTIFTQQAQKRNYSSAFTSPNVPIDRPRAPPAVPSFGIDFNALLPKRTSATDDKSTAQRKGNVLGLTPSTQRPEAEAESDEDDGENDESKLASALATDTISFEHKGQTLSLRSPAEIAVWIEERRRKFPTQAKAEAAKKIADEKKRQWEEAKQARQEAGRSRREEHNKIKTEREKSKVREKLIAVQVQKAKAAVASAKIDPTEKVRQKAERLRKKAERATQQLRAAEEALQRAEMVDSDKAQQGSTALSSGAEHAEQGAMGIPLSTLNPSNSLGDIVSNSDSDILPESELESDLDETSSSGSSDDGASDLDSDSDAPPEESSSKLTSPQLIPPPPRTLSEPRKCRTFLKFGTCKFGRKCRFSHDVPEKSDSTTKRKERVATVGTRRKGLFQVMVEKEVEEDRKKGLRAIIALGERGLLGNIGIDRGGEQGRTQEDKDVLTKIND